MYGGCVVVVWSAQSASSPSYNPPKFVLFTTGQLDPGYVRFVERKLREEFEFTGTPIEIAVKPRKRQGRGRS